MTLERDRRLTGIALMLLTYLLFTGIDTSAKWLIEAGLPPLQVVFVRFAVHLAIVVAVLYPRTGTRLFLSADRPREVLRALCLLGGTVFNFLALQYLPLTVTTAIFFTIPLWVCALSVPLLGERVGIRRWVAILVGFTGVLVATRPWTGEMHWAVLFSVAAAVSASLYSILTRKLVGVDSPHTQQLYGAAIPFLAITPFGLAEWQWPAMGIDWAFFLLIGVFGWAGHQTITMAHRYAPASVLAPFIYSMILYMTASSWLIFDQPADAWVLVGSAIVLSSGLYVWWRERAIAAQ